MSFHIRTALASVASRMRAFLILSRIRDRISVSGLVLVVMLLLAACEQKGGGPGY